MMFDLRLSKSSSC